MQQHGRPSRFPLCTGDLNFILCLKCINIFVVVVVVVVVVVAVVVVVVVVVVVISDVQMYFVHNTLAYQEM